MFPYVDDASRTLSNLVAELDVILLKNPPTLHVPKARSDLGSCTGTRKSLNPDQGLRDSWRRMLPAIRA